MACDGCFPGGARLERSDRKTRITLRLPFEDKARVERGLFSVVTYFGGGFLVSAVQRLQSVAGEPTTSPPYNLTVIRRMVNMACLGSEREKVDEITRLAAPLVDSTVHTAHAA